MPTKDTIHLPPEWTDPYFNLLGSLQQPTSREVIVEVVVEALRSTGNPNSVVESYLSQARSHGVDLLDLSLAFCGELI